MKTVAPQQIDNAIAHTFRLFLQIRKSIATSDQFPVQSHCRDLVVVLPDKHKPGLI